MAELDDLRAEVARLHTVYGVSERARLKLEAEVVRLRERGAKLTANLAGVSQTEREQAEAAGIGREYRAELDEVHSGIGYYFDGVFATVHAMRVVLAEQGLFVISVAEKATLDAATNGRRLGP